jgi:hypothetical protein
MLDGATIDIQDAHLAGKLTCGGTATCSGKLTLTAIARNGKGKKRAKTEIVGTAAFSITAGKAGVVKLTLDKAGRALLKAVRGHLSATLTILKMSPAPGKTQTRSVRLERRSAG